MEVQIEKILVNLLTQYLDLPDNYGKDSKGNEIPCVIIKNQNIKLFTTPHLQISVTTLGSNVFANNNEVYQETDTEGNTNFYEKVMINEQRQMQIDCYSRNNEARKRFWEVQAALESTLSQQLQEQYQFRISRISNSFNLSGQDGGSDINRFTVRFNCLTWNTKIKQIDYYDTFPLHVQDDKNLSVDYTIDNNLTIQK